MEAGLEPDPRGGERVRHSAGRRLRDQRRAGVLGRRAQVEDGLARGDRVELDSGGCQQRGGPGAGRDDDSVRVDRAGAGLDPDAVRSSREPCGRGLLVHLGACGAGGCGERLDAPVGEQQPAVGLQQRAVRKGDPEAAANLPCVEALGGHPAGRQRRLVLGDERARVERARRHEQLAAGLALQLSPESERPLREPDVGLLGVGQPEDPRPAVARAASVAEVEPLEHANPPAPSRERPGGGETVDPGADDDDGHGRWLRRGPSAGR